MAGGWPRRAARARTSTLSLGRGGLGLGGELTAAAVATRERGYTWMLRDGAPPTRSSGVSASQGPPRSADRGAPPARARLRYEQGGLRAQGMLSRGSVVGVSLGLSSQDVSGTRTDARSGRTTVYVQRTVEGSLSLTHVSVGVGATAAHGDRERYAVTYDADGARRPHGDDDRQLPDLGRPAQPPAVGGRLLSAPTGHGRVYVEETHLDLPTREPAPGQRLPRAGPPSGAVHTPAPRSRSRLPCAGAWTLPAWSTPAPTKPTSGAMASMLGGGVEGGALGASVVAHACSTRTSRPRPRRGSMACARVRRDCLSRVA
jgi:hypothetical protein